MIAFNISEINKLKKISALHITILFICWSFRHTVSDFPSSTCLQYIQFLDNTLIATGDIVTKAIKIYELFMTVVQLWS